MASWRFSMLGSELAVPVQKAPVALPDVVWTMLGCLLAAPRRTLSRTQLAAELWPESRDDDARNCLSSAVWRIRKSLPCFDRLVDTANDHFRILPAANIWIDVLAFERRAVRSLSEPSHLDRPDERRRLERSLSLYRGDFLAQRACESIMIERERLRALFLDSGYLLAATCARHGEWQSTRKLCAGLCVVEPLREDLQRLLIEAYLETGNRALALRQYNRLRACLSNELQVEPMPESQALARRIAGEAPGSNDCAVDLVAAPENMRLVLMSARQQLVSTLSLIDRALTH